MNNTHLLLIIIILALWFYKNYDNYINYIDPTGIKKHPDFEGTSKEKQLIYAQKIVTEALEDFNNVCKKYNLKYIVVGGTLLGTLRHRGWIPWDDDIDVAMMKEDMDKLLHIYNSNEYLKSKYLINNGGKKYHRLKKIRPRSDPHLILDIFQMNNDGNNYYDLVKNPNYYTNNRKVHIDDLFPTKYGKFSYLQVPIGNNPEKLLELGTTTSGERNYSKLPSIDKRRPHNSL